MLLLVTALSLSLAPRAFSSDLLVYNNNDSSAGSLRQRILDNNGTPTGGNTIIFSNIVTGTITLTSGELLITKPLTIIGPGANVLAVTANHASRVFYVSNAATVNISGLTISNSGTNTGLFFYGGGVYNDATTLTVSNCTIRGNTAKKKGGGICNTGTLKLLGSTVSDNWVSEIGGGGLCNFGFPAAVTITNCTFSGNSAPTLFGGGAILNEGSTSTLTVIASTFSGNTLSSSYNYTAGGISIDDGSLEIGNTILNAGTWGTNIYNHSGTVTSHGYNLCSDGGFGVLTGVGDQNNTNPNLGPLQDNGGPTPTCAPLAGSLAIDQGKSFGLTTDQRGRPRTYDYPATPNASLGDGTDIGAVEFSPIGTLVVSNTNDQTTGSLRQAVVDAAPGDAITFATNVTGAITLTGGELLVAKNLTILGPGAKVLAVNGNAASRVFNISTGIVNIAGLAITNGRVANDLGGGIKNYGTLTLSHCRVSQNQGTNNSSGGGIFNAYPGSLTLSNCVVSDNTAGISGGGLYNYLATLTIVNSTIAANNATNGAGGGIRMQGGTADIRSSTLAINSTAGPSGGPGGAIASDAGAVMTFRNTLIAKNTAGTGPDLYGAFTSAGYNLVGNSDSSSGFTDGVNHDQVGFTPIPLNPLLGSLRDNGGPTPTMALLSNSPAIDKGQSFGLTTDQRGAPRPYDFSSATNASGGDGSDIGAFELGRPTLNIQKFNTNAVLSWQSYYGDFTLQSVTNVIASNSWAAVAGTPVVVANQYVLTNGPISSNRLFRLKGN